MENLANVLKQRRAELGLTLKQVADAVGVSEATVQRWESGKATPTRLSFPAPAANAENTRKSKTSGCFVGARGGT